MAKVGEFLKNHFKLVILALIIIVAVVIFASVNSNKSETVDVYKELEYKYFDIYSKENKVGVVNSNRRNYYRANLYRCLYSKCRKRCFFLLFSRK